MEQERQNPALRFAESTLIALCLVVGIYAGGHAVGTTLLQMQKEYRIELFNRAVEDQGLVSKIISDEEMHAATTRYIAALADAVVRFEFFPRKDDGETFINLISVLPAQVRIEKFEFIGRNLTISCTAPTKELLEQFSHSMLGTTRFQDTSLECYQKKDGTFIGTITCLA